MGNQVSSEALLAAQFQEMRGLLRHLSDAARGGTPDLPDLVTQAEEMLAGQSRRVRTRWTPRELDQEAKLAGMRDALLQWLTWADDALPAKAERPPSLTYSIALTKLALSDNAGSQRLLWEQLMRLVLLPARDIVRFPHGAVETDVAYKCLVQAVADYNRFIRTEEWFD